MLALKCRLPGRWLLPTECSHLTPVGPNGMLAAKQPFREVEANQAAPVPRVRAGTSRRKSWPRPDRPSGSGWKSELLLVRSAFVRSRATPLPGAIGHAPRQSRSATFWF